MVAALAAASALVATPPARAAFLPLPATGAQVNDDPVNSIDPGQDAGVSDVTGGAVTAGASSRSSFARSRTAPG
ncbi:MAG: hypothetical protein DMF95_31200 [Acidobacteria bacterium]|nr:MAG: hypothetical protein DMF95_31200 [Acidobacteriota bacterium]